MKVHELKALLKDLEDDVDVAFRMTKGCCGEYFDLELDYADSYEDPVNKKSYEVELRFMPVPGYKSCIQASKTEKEHRLYWDGFISQKE